MNLPDVESMVIAFLDARVTPSVHSKVPNPRPASFVRAWRNGGAAVNQVLETAHITVDAYAADSVSASALARQCRQALLGDYTAMPLVRGVSEVTGLYYNPDGEARVDRYRFTVALMVRAERP